MDVSRLMRPAEQIGAGGPPRAIARLTESVVDEHGDRHIPIEKSADDLRSRRRLRRVGWVGDDDVGVSVNVSSLRGRSRFGFGGRGGSWAAFLLFSLVNLGQSLAHLLLDVLAPHLTKCLEVPALPESATAGRAGVLLADRDL